MLQSASHRILHSLKDGERELVVAGGRFADDAVEIFNFGRWEWREGPDLPQRMDDTASIQA